MLRCQGEKVKEESGLFETIIDRADSFSIKWGRYSQSGILTFGTAGMDFKSPSCVWEALIKMQRVAFMRTNTNLMIMTM
ncbi:hypothetical protein KOSB73_40152 [Klebsiella grimontii]|uniref:Uncharacterized protein n=1 Tax=Klebsiella grimontii TaxID=2058152 RepID=A0A285B9T9_9ENTR|nr:hypothetical protein KOSB73_40152 [Klebsiella grimontii]